MVRIFLLQRLRLYTSSSESARERPFRSLQTIAIREVVGVARVRKVAGRPIFECVVRKRTTKPMVGRIARLDGLRGCVAPVPAYHHPPRRRGTRGSRLLPVQPGQCGAAVAHRRGSSPLEEQPEFVARGCPDGPWSKTAFLLTQTLSAYLQPDFSSRPRTRLLQHPTLRLNLACSR